MASDRDDDDDDDDEEEEDAEEEVLPTAPLVDGAFSVLEDPLLPLEETPALQ